MGAGRKLPHRRENALLMEDGSNGRRLVVFAHKTYWNVAAILLPDDSASTSKPEQRPERMPCPGMRKSEKRLPMNRSAHAPRPQWPRTVNFVAADVRRLILFRAEEVGASLRRLLRFMASTHG